MGHTIEIFTDGSCDPNPGPGGWAFLLKHNKDGVIHTESASGNSRQTTNNLMEMQGPIEALRAIKGFKGKVTLTTDSRYVMDGITKYIVNWKRNGWKLSNKGPVKNQPQWKILDDLNTTFNITWFWVKGHNGHIENEYVDKLAGEAMRKAKNGISMVPCETLAKNANYVPVLQQDSQDRKRKAQDVDEESDLKVQKTVEIKTTKVETVVEIETTGTKIEGLSENLTVEDIWAEFEKARVQRDKMLALLEQSKKQQRLK